MFSPLQKSFYEGNTIQIAKNLLGKKLVVNHPSGEQMGLIVETEAYRGTNDKACHASWRKKSSCLSLWGPPGHLYVYLTYGIHYMLNIVTEKDDFPAAVLIRALEPIKGIFLPTNGPGKLTKSLGIDKSFDGRDLFSQDIFIANNQLISDSTIVTAARIGVDYAQDWKDKPWRFYLKDNPFVSRK